MSNKAKDFDSEKKLDLELFLKSHSEKELILLKNLVDKLLLQKSIDNEISIPLSIFSKNLNPAEALIKFLKENKNLRFSEISKLLDKKENTVWLSYKRAESKSKNPFETSNNEKISLPIHIFKIKELSSLEAIVIYLRQELRLSNNEIASLLKKSPQVLSISYNRAKNKLTKK